MSIVIIEPAQDKADILAFMVQRLQRQAVVAFSCREALKVESKELLIIDVGRSGLLGFQSYRELTKVFPQPIFLLGEERNEEEIAEWLRLGAEEFIAWPCNPTLFSARLQKALKNVTRGNSNLGVVNNSQDFGDFRLDYRSRVLSCQEQTIRLTRLQFKILNVLLRTSGQIVPHEELIREVWGYNDCANSTIVKGHVHGLRVKLENVGSQTKIQIVPGVGYRLDPWLAQEAS